MGSELDGRSQAQLSLIVAPQEAGLLSRRFILAPIPTQWWIICSGQVAFNGEIKYPFGNILS
jgi:hypothetical protein